MEVTKTGSVSVVLKNGGGGKSIRVILSPYHTVKKSFESSLNYESLLLCKNIHDSSKRFPLAKDQ